MTFDYEELSFGNLSQKSANSMVGYLTSRHAQIIFLEIALSICRNEFHSQVMVLSYFI